MVDLLAMEVFSISYVRDGSRTIVPEKNCPPTLILSLIQTQIITVTGGQFPLGAIVRESLEITNELNMKAFLLTVEVELKLLTLLVTFYFYQY